MKLSYIPPLYEALRRTDPSLTLARVACQEKDRYSLLSSDGLLPAVCAGRLRHEVSAASDYPVVGDYVMVKLSPDGLGIIQSVLPRQSLFLRRAAGPAGGEQAVTANINTVWLCMSLNQDFNPRRLERYLAVIWDSGATPVVVLTKADLCECPSKKQALAEAVAPGVDVCTVSVRLPDGCAPLQRYLAPGKTLALVGSSGAGKSTLVNWLLGEDRLKTNSLRNNDKGRHTTTRRELFLLPGGATVIDTPGMRELGLWDASDGLTDAFADIEALAAHCRFRNCTHGSEPGCAVQAALADGRLSKDRLCSYRKLRTELAYTRDPSDYRATKETRFKEIAKYNKERRKSGPNKNLSKN